MSSKRKEILDAAMKAIDELIGVLRDPITSNPEDALSADKMKNAAAAKRLAFDDALYMLERIEQLNEAKDKSSIEAKVAEIPVSFAESLAKEKKK
jgi:hypothetical protein